MADRFVTVPDSLELPASVLVPIARLSDAGTAGRAVLDAETAADGRAALGAVDATGVSAAINLPRVVYVETWTSLFGGIAGAFPAAIWVNSSHLTGAGLATWAAHVLAGSTIPTTGAVKVVWFGDSWISQDPAVLTAATIAHNPSATTVVSGVSGNTSTMMLARLAADVPVDANYVIFNEPGVNDVYQGFSAQTVAENLAALVAAIRGKGALPVFAGVVPLADYANPSATRNAETAAQIGAGVQYPALPASAMVVPAKPEADSLGIGGGLAKVTTGAGNTAVGVRAGAGLTSGADNTMLGREAGTAITSGTSNAAFGHNALRAGSSGSSNTALGTSALASQTTASSCTGIGFNAGVLNTASANTFIGVSAGYAPAGVAANATTTSDKQTVIGVEAGQGNVSATAQGEITAIGYRARSGGFNATAIGSQAVASAHDATAIGRGATASGVGAVAIGVDNTAAAASASGTNEFKLGTALHNVKVAGRFNVAPRTPTGSADASGTAGDIAADDSYLYVKTSTGWKRAALTAW